MLRLVYLQYLHDWKYICNSNLYKSYDFQGGVQAQNRSALYANRPLSNSLYYPIYYKYLNIRYL
jgi:hypothetical protein